VLQHLLDIIQGETAEDSQTTIQPNVLSEHQCARSGSRDDHGRKSRKSDDGDASEERSAQVEVLFLLGGCADKSNGTHHADGVETSAGKDDGVHEEERREEQGLSDVEAGPEGVLLHIADIISIYHKMYQYNKMYLLFRPGGHCAVHGTDAAHQSNTEHQPRVCTHQSKAPSVHVQSACRHANDSDAQSRVHKRVVEIAPFEVGHAAIFAGFAVEDEVDTQERRTKDASAVEHALAHIALRNRIVGRLLVRAAEGSAETERILWICWRF
jgi:hypothetical protein